MNVKPGDLAIVLNSRNGNEGKIVEVLSYVGKHAGYENCWWVRGRTLKNICGSRETLIAPDA